MPMPNPSEMDDMLIRNDDTDVDDVEGHGITRARSVSEDREGPGRLRANEDEDEDDVEGHRRM